MLLGNIRSAAVSDLAAKVLVVVFGLAITVRGSKPTFFEVKGEANDHYYYFTKAILPLRGEQGEIVKCLVPFTDKLPDIPADLRHKFLSIDIDQ